MNVLIISTNITASPMPVLPLGACIVAEAARQAGHAVRFVDLMFEKDPAAAVQKEIKRYPPDVIGMSIRNIDNNNMPVPAVYYKDVLRITQSVRAVSHAPLIIGGAAVGIMPEAFLRLTGALGAVVGPGEQVFPEIVHCLVNNVPVENIPGLVTLKNGTLAENRKNRAFSSCTCHVPDYKHWIDLNRYLSRMASIPFQTKRGCPFRCVYCTYGMCEGRQLEVAPQDEVVNHIKRLSSQGFKDIEFVDAVFNYPYEHALSICEGLIEAETGARFQTYNLNPGFIDEQLLADMKKAGFCGIGVSAESGSDEVLKGLRKNYSVQQLCRAAEAIAVSGLPCFWMFILGSPGETEQSIDETFRFASAYIKPKDVVLMSMGIRIYPGTELETLARREGVLTVPANEMLEAATYISPLIDAVSLAKRIGKVVNENMNYINPGVMQTPLLGGISTVMNWVGADRPFWKHTRLFRRSFRMIGVSV